MLKQFTKAEKSWMMYDWANSAQSVIVVTLLPVFYQTINSANPQALDTWGYCTSISMLIVALMAPILGALGDFKDNKKRILTVFMLLGAISCVVQGVTPQMDLANSLPMVSAIIIVCYIIAQIGFAGANVMYDSLLSDVTTDERMDKVSTMGFGMGYIGGSSIPLIIFLVLAAFCDMNFALSVAFILTGIWWAVFSIPLLKNVQQVHYVERKKGAIGESLANLKETGKAILKNKEMLVFLLAYFFYIDGVNTIIHMSTIYGSSLGIDTTQMMLALLLTQVMGLPFAMVYVKCSEKFGAKFMIGVGIVIYMIICVFGFFIDSAADFWVLAVLVGTSQGGIQALSRSYFGKIIPDKNRSGEYFGFYDVFGKFSAFIGPTLFAVTTAAVRNQKMAVWGLEEHEITETIAGELSRASNPYGVLSVLALFIIGGGLFLVVLPIVKKRALVNAR